MKFIKFTIIYLFFTIGYLAYLLSKLEPLHVHEIALTFIAIGSVLAGGVKKCVEVRIFGGKVDLCIK